MPPRRPIKLPRLTHATVERLARQLADLLEKRLEAQERLDRARKVD